MITSLIHALQSLSFTACTLLVPAVLALVVFMLPWIRKKCGIETSSDMADSASEGFSAIALFFVFIAASSLSTVQGFQKDGLKVTEQEVAQITNFDRELVHAGGEKAEAARAALKNYVSEIINKEWKTMEEGKSSKDVDAALGKIISIVNHMEPKGKLTEKSIDALIARLEHVSDIRDERIEVSNLHLSEIYWDIIFCFVLMLLVIAFFTSDKPPKRVGLAGKMIALSFTLVLLIQTDGVFYGDIAVKPTLLTNQMEKMKVRTEDSN
jgi:hypothetical protein